MKMSRVNVRRLGEGLHPSEVVVTVVTAEGVEEEVSVHSGSLSGDTLEVGHPISKAQGRVLVELPRETARGFWRLWVPADAVTEEQAA
jgi:hypothetical protein